MEPQIDSVTIVNMNYEVFQKKKIDEQSIIVTTSFCPSRVMSHEKLENVFESL